MLPKIIAIVLFAFPIQVVMVTGYTVHRVRHITATERTFSMEQLSCTSPPTTTTAIQVQTSKSTIILDTCIDRRKVLVDTAKIIPVSAAAMLPSTPAVADSSITTGATTTTDSTGSKNSLINQLLDQLRTIPTFCIVSNTTGAAYMIYKRDLNMGIGYAFLTYDGAVTVLNEAKQNAIQKGYSNVWTNATITTLPLDVAIRLTLKKRNRIAVNNRNDTSKVQSLDTLLQIIPGADERFDGMAIDKDRFQDQGRVPLFFVLNDNQDDDNNKEKMEYYFNRKDLIRDWTKQQEAPNTTLPNIGAIDLVGIFESLLLGRNVQGKIGSGAGTLLFPTSTSTSNGLIQTEFIGNSESIATAKALKANGPLTPYNPNQMIL
jgi:hypothetical protein